MYLKVQRLWLYVGNLMIKFAHSAWVVVVNNKCGQVCRPSSRTPTLTFTGQLTDVPTCRLLFWRSVKLWTVQLMKVIVGYFYALKIISVISNWLLRRWFGVSEVVMQALLNYTDGILCRWLYEREVQATHAIKLQQDTSFHRVGQFSSLGGKVQHVSLKCLFW